MVSVRAKFTSVLTAPREIVRLDAPGAGNWQGAVRNRLTGDWFMAEAKPTAGGEDCIIYRFTSSGGYLSKMLLKNGGHQTAFDVTDVNTLWVAWGGDMVAIPYRVGTATKSQGKIVPDFGATQMSGSPTGIWVACRGKGGIVRRRRSDILAGVDKPWGKPVVVDWAGQTPQGFTLVNDLCYTLTGRPSRSQVNVISRYSFTTGKLVDRIKIPVDGEAEGMSGAAFGVKREHGTKRYLGVYAIPPALRSLSVLA